MSWAWQQYVSTNSITQRSPAHYDGITVIGGSLFVTFPVCPSVPCSTDCNSSLVLADSYCSHLVVNTDQRVNSSVSGKINEEGEYSHHEKFFEFNFFLLKWKHKPCQMYTNMTYYQTHLSPTLCWISLLTFPAGISISPNILCIIISSHKTLPVFVQ